MKYVGPIAKLPIVAALLINIIIFAFTRTLNPIEAVGNFLGAYLLCRWIIVPIFAKRVYIRMCRECNQIFETEVDKYVCPCFQTQLESIFYEQAVNETKIQTVPSTGGISYCRHCGHKITPGNFCSSCGQKL
ncbi:hypothetical protein COJ85_27635 [Bacillus sp. AFS076308]|nr:hypothetical protein COJ85_27635 [Bacillus sp. AFS076308]PGV44227.1 hypothetical protein COD92_31385 [Bacillus sp. AFS037270]